MADRLGGDEGSRIGAFFDLDRTLIAGYSAIAFGRDLLRSGHLDLWALQPELARVRLATGADRASPDYASLMSLIAGLLVGLRESDLIALGEALCEAEYLPRLYPEAFPLVASHRARGHTMVIASAATEFQVRPIAEAFGIDHVVCTRFETFAERLTGDVSVAAWGEGKRDAVAAFAEDHGIGLDESFFYSDGIEDLPLLEIVGKPRPTNPDESLARVAEERGWETTHFAKGLEPTAWELARPLLERGRRGSRVDGWRDRLDRALDGQIRMGYRTAHWLRRSRNRTPQE